MALTLSEVSQRMACAPLLAVMFSILLRRNRPAHVARESLPVRAKNPFRLPLAERRSVSIHAQFLALASLFGDWFLLRHHGCCKAGRTPITKIDNEHNILALCAMPRGFFRATAAILTRKRTRSADHAQLLDGG